jgi:tetratricopeptide (TPR) repeat protein
MNPQEIPEDLDGRTNSYRRVTSGRKVLILLDNASSHNQVDHLLPGAATCAVVVTSRFPIGLFATDIVRLQTFEEEEGVLLLANLIGSARVAAELSAAGRLVTLCGGLPLAIRIAGGQLRSEWGKKSSLSNYCEMLAAEENRIAAFTLADQNVRASFKLSYELLSSEQARLFRSLSLLSGPDFCADVADHLAQNNPVAGRGALVHLANVNLLEVTASKRYGFHNLLRLYAQEQYGYEGLGERDVDWMRVALWCVTLAEEAERHSYRADQQAWLNRLADEHENLRGIMQWCNVSESALINLRLVGALGWYYWARGHFREGRNELERALAPQRLALARSTDPDVASGAEAQSRAALGRLLGHLGEYQEAFQNIRKSVQLFRDTGSARGQALALDAVGVMLCDLGYFSLAERVLACCMQLVRGVDEWMFSHVLYDHGDVLRHLRRFEDAERELADSLDLRQKLNDVRGVAASKGSLGRVKLDLALQEVSSKRRRRLLGDAKKLLSQSLSTFEEARDASFEAWARYLLGRVHLALGQKEEAATLFLASLRGYVGIGSTFGVPRALEGLGAVAIAKGGPLHAARLLGAAAAYRSAHHLVLSPADNYVRARDVAALNRKLRPEEVKSAWNAGEQSDLRSLVPELGQDGP